MASEEKANEMSSQADPTGLRYLPIHTYYLMFPRMADHHHQDNELFNECVRARNPYALYLQSIRLAFALEQLEAAMALLRESEEEFTHSKLLLLMLGYCSGESDAARYMDLWYHYSFAEPFIELDKIGAEVVKHIQTLVCRREYNFLATFKCADVPTKECSHPSQKRCIECFFYRLARKICGGFDTKHEWPHPCS